MITVGNSENQQDKSAVERDKFLGLVLKGQQQPSHQDQAVYCIDKTQTQP